jgi:hypothetical protein
VLPNEFGRLHVLWIFKDTISFQQYSYTQDIKEGLWSASRIADCHRHEEAPYKSSEDDTIEVFDFFVYEGATS